MSRQVAGGGVTRPAPGSAAALAAARSRAEAVRARLETIDLPPDMKLEIMADATRANAADLLVDIETASGAAREAIEKIVYEMIGVFRRQLPKEDISTILNLGQDRLESSHMLLLLSLTPQRAKDAETIARRMRTAANEVPGVRTRVPTYLIATTPVPPASIPAPVAQSA